MVKKLDRGSRTSGKPYALIGSVFGSAVAAFAATLIVIRPAYSAPSFKCSRAYTAVDTLICASLDLSNQDAELAAIYRRDMQLATDRQRMLMSERAWLKSRASVCSLQERKLPPNGIGRFRALLCLTNLYDARLTRLETTFDRLVHTAASAPPKIRVNDITSDKVTHEVIANFQSNLPMFDTDDRAAVASCTDVLSYVAEIGGHDSSFGAACRIDVDGKSLNVLMCNDWLVGKWHIAASQGVIDRQRLSRFIGDECPPGG